MARDDEKDDAEKAEEAKLSTADATTNAEGAREDRDDDNDNDEEEVPAEAKPRQKSARSPKARRDGERREDRSARSAAAERAKPSAAKSGGHVLPSLVSSRSAAGLAAGWFGHDARAKAKLRESGPVAAGSSGPCKEWEEDLAPVAARSPRPVSKRRAPPALDAADLRKRHQRGAGHAGQGEGCPGLVRQLGQQSVQRPAQGLEHVQDGPRADRKLPRRSVQRNARALRASDPGTPGDRGAGWTPPWVGPGMGGNASRDAAWDATGDAAGRSPLSPASVRFFGGHRGSLVGADHHSRRWRRDCAARKMPRRAAGAEHEPRREMGVPGRQGRAYRIGDLLRWLARSSRSWASSSWWVSCSAQAPRTSGPKS